MGAVEYQKVPSKEVGDVEKEKPPVFVVNVAAPRRVTGKALKICAVVLALVFGAGLLVHKCAKFHMHGHFHPHGPMSPAALDQKLVFSEVIGASLQTYYANPSTYGNQVQCLDCLQEELQALFDATESSLDSSCVETESPALASFCEFHGKSKTMSPLIAFAKADVDFVTPALSKCASAGPCKVKAGRSVSMEIAKSTIVHMVGPFAHGPAKEIFRAPRVEFTTAGAQASCHDCVAKGLIVASQTADDFFAEACKATEHLPKHVQDMCKTAIQYPFLAKTALLLNAKPWDTAVAECVFQQSCAPPSPERPIEEGDEEVEGPVEMSKASVMPFIPTGDPMRPSWHMGPHDHSMKGPHDIRGRHGRKDMPGHHKDDEDEDEDGEEEKKEDAEEMKEADVDDLEKDAEVEGTEMEEKAEKFKKEAEKGEKERHAKGKLKGELHKFLHGSRKEMGHP